MDAVVIEGLTFKKGDSFETTTGLVYVQAITPTGRVRFLYRSAKDKKYSVWTFASKTLAVHIRRDNWQPMI